MRTPVVVVTGIDRAAMDAAMLTLLWDLPASVAVKHTIDPVAQVLTRVVSDASGVLDRHQVQLEHACITCALREDIIPTLSMLADDGRWQNIVACLPVAAEAEQLGRCVTHDPHLARRIRLASVVAAVEPNGLVDDLLGNDLLSERDLHSSPDDERGVGETGCALIEYADAVAFTSLPDTPERDLVGALARPDAHIVVGTENLDAAALAGARHQHQRAATWRIPTTADPLPSLGSCLAWRLDLSSTRPFHADRLLDQISRLGTGRHRTRGCFWLASRPGTAVQWDGSGGQLSIGPYGDWGSRSPVTRLVFTGLGRPTAGLVDAFDDLLLTPAEASARHLVVEDGFEPWLGHIRDVA